MSIANFFQLVRWKNLIMIALIQLIFRYVYFPTFGIDVALDHLHFVILIIATVSTAAAGNVINDIYDIRADHINKPSKLLITDPQRKKSANTIYALLNVLGFTAGLYLSIKVNNASFVGIFIFTALLLKWYSSFLKRKPVVGNLAVSVLISVSILIVAFFDIIPAITEDNGIRQYLGFYTLLDYAIFAFMFNFIREIVKDIEDVNGDLLLEMKTIPILFGRKRTRNIVFGISFIPLIVVTLYSFKNFSQLPFVLAYMLIVVMLPFMYFMSKLLYAKRKDDYRYLSRLLKYIMLLGILSILVLSISIHYAQ